jgi:hypothetical protein
MIICMDITILCTGDEELDSLSRGEASADVMPV